MAKTTEESNYWASNYIQHSARIVPGRDGLFNLNRSTPQVQKLDADVVRVADGVLAEHWDVLQDEATKAESRSGLPMFGTTFPE